LPERSSLPSKRLKLNYVPHAKSFGQVINVPERFRPSINVAYPESNRPIFEEWFYTQCIAENYLPIFWTSYWVNHRYGKDRKAKADLQRFIDTLPDTSMFTIVQYDDGPLIELPSNIKVFAMSGPRIDYPLPLICQSHKYQFNEERSIFASFVGRLTHPIREKMMKVLAGQGGYLTSNNILSTQEYCQIMSKSIFTLCPRGYGQTSFRICEALQYGSIPVYISDNFLIPHNDNFEDYGVLIKSADVENIHDTLRGITPAEMARKWSNGKKIYNEKFSFQGCKDVILSQI
jgi:hypothetical protein